MISLAGIQDEASKLMEKPLEECKQHLFDVAFAQNFASNQRLRILEVGVGVGTNFKYFPSNATLDLLDSTEKHMRHVHESFALSNRVDLFIEKVIVASVEDMHIIPTGVYDAVVGTLLLCSVENPHRALLEISRVLKPGGIYVFIEHSKDMVHGWRKMAQIIVQPLWKIIFQGCKFQDLMEIFKNTPGFSKLQVYYFQNVKHNIVFLVSQPIYYGFFKK